MIQDSHTPDIPCKNHGYKKPTLHNKPASAARPLKPKPKSNAPGGRRGPEALFELGVGQWATGDDGHLGALGAGARWQSDGPGGFALNGCSRQTEGLASKAIKVEKEHLFLSLT